MKQIDNDRLPDGMINLYDAYKNSKGNAFKNCVSQISELIDAKIASNFEGEYRKRSFEKFRNEIQPVDGILDLIKSLEIPFCVASSGPEKNKT
jgi:beta-phosphoglucomutase-like phosphatase (HAD superfamily)